MQWMVLRVAELFARAGGGGSSGGGGGGGHSSGGSSFHSSSGSGGSSGPTPWWFWIVFLGFWGLMFAIFILVMARAGKKLKAKQNAQLAAAAKEDPAWSELTNEAKELFKKFQQDWQDFNLQPMQTYLEKSYYEHVVLMMTALRNLGRQNTMNKVNIFSAQVVDMDDQAGTDADTANVKFSATADDRLIIQKTGEILTSTNEFFTETWQLVREKGKWKLAGIKQATEEAGSLVASISEFAKTNGLYYSPDWGRLLLPQRGQLFGGASFERSDVNNHCIGLHGKILIELYTYVPNVNKTTTNYLVAQATLPKSYVDIVVRAKQGWKLFSGIRGLNKISMEWEEFNDRYEVFASDEEQVTSFELLHPVFMEKLFALPFKVSIEAVDNVVYLYTTDSGVDYSQMLQVLNDAFKELKL